MGFATDMIMNMAMNSTAGRYSFNNGTANTKPNTSLAGLPPPQYNNTIGQQMQQPMQQSIQQPSQQYSNPYQVSGKGRGKGF